eukprot:CAMPEP_0116025254 /NCGR_PEP_ID=MMETSP0321-20121206/12921_1 /TAXON_ID=163516 /ORGANISM="Leptocylindrus danicus var. danicus, Strain B650" /LENGTH=555 /DNA_ID=CAMNT_0003497377 /DNA_START=438 /DNA_END=2102 /DNA_ORIENTATION=-
MKNSRRFSQESLQVIVDEDDDALLSWSEEAQQERLYNAIEKNKTEVALDILKASNLSCTYIHPSNDSGWTMLHWASFHGNEVLVDALLATDAPTAYKTYKFKNRVKPGIASKESRTVSMNTPLHRAAQRGHLGVCWLLSLSSYSVNDVDSIGNSPLHLAASHDHKRVVKFLIEDGCDVSRKNMFHNTAYDVASENCKPLLFQAMASEGAGLNQKKKMHQTNVENYVRAGNDITGAIESDSWRDKEKLKNAIFCAEELGVAQVSIDLGRRFLARLELIENLEAHIERVKQVDVIKTQTSYVLVDQLKICIKEVENYVASQVRVNPLRQLTSFLASTLSRESQLNDLPHMKVINDLVEQGHFLCEKSHNEYWLNAAYCKLKSRDTRSVVRSTDESLTKDMAALEEATEKALSAGANAMLVADASQFHAKLASEIELHQSRSRIPKVREYNPEMTPAEGKDYWQDDDIGRIEETVEYPLPPEDGNYKWIESSSLTSLRLAITEFTKSITKAKENGANEEILEESKAFLSQQNKIRDLLITKDEIDREEAVKNVQKMCK